MVASPSGHRGQRKPAGEARRRCRGKVNLLAFGAALGRRATESGRVGAGGQRAAELAAHWPARRQAAGRREENGATSGNKAAQWMWPAAL